MPREGAARQPLCAAIDGLSLHAAVRLEAHERKRLEQPLHHPAGACRRTGAAQQCKAGAARVRDAVARRTPHQIMNPLEFMQQLVVLVPKPSLNLISLVST